MNFCQQLFYPGKIYACIRDIRFLYNHHDVYEHRYYWPPTIFLLVLLIYWVRLYGHCYYYYYYYYHYCDCFWKKDTNGTIHEVIKETFQCSQYGLDCEPFPLLYMQNSYVIYWVISNSFVVEVPGQKKKLILQLRPHKFYK